MDTTVFDSLVSSQTMPIAVLAVSLLVVFIILVKSSAGFHTQATSRMEPAPPEEGPLDFFALINKGNQSLALYQYDEALGYFQQALRFKRNDPSVHFKIGRIFEHKEDYANAIKAFRYVLELEPAKIEAHYELGRIHLLLGQTAEAHQNLDRALELNPHHEESLKLKVKVHEKDGDYPAMLPVLEKLLVSNNRKKEYRQQYADTLFRAGRHERAISEYKSLSEWDPAHASRYQARIAQIHYEREEYAQAIEAFRPVFDAGGSEAHDPVLRSQMAASLCNEGVRRFEDGSYDNAIRNYLLALEYDQSNPDIYFNLGKAYTQSGNLYAAQQNYEEVLKLNPEDLSAYYELAMLFDNQGKPREAIQYYKTCLEKDPGFSRAAFGLGTLYGIQGELQESVRWLSEAVRIDPRYIDAIYNLAVAQEKLKQVKKAVQLYKKVLEIDKNHVEARSNLAHLQREARGG